MIMDAGQITSLVFGRDERTIQICKSTSIVNTDVVSHVKCEQARDVTGKI